MTKLVFIPDTQVKAGVPTDHLLAAGRYIVAHKPDVVVVAGDWWDMSSLNKYGTNLELEGERIDKDLQAGREALDLFMSPLTDYNNMQRRNKKVCYRPRLVYTVGNHDPQVRIPRLISEYPILQGILKEDEATKWLEAHRFQVVPFLEVISIEGIRFSHYHVNSHSARKGPLGGQIETMLKNAGYSFIQGHTQGLKMGKFYLSDGSRRLGIVAGSFYQHYEDFMGPQGNGHWHGIIQLNEVRDGGGDICELSLDYLRRHYL